LALFAIQRKFPRQPADRKLYRLDAGELPVLEMPVGVVEIGEVVGVPHVLGRQAGLEAAGERDHLVGLGRLHLLEELEEPAEELAGAVVTGLGHGVA
jgi:hypothetical protein